MALTQIPSGMIAPAQTLSLNGVTFPATQVPSADANTLDDYEEGSFDATISMQSGTCTLASGYNKMNYTKIGRLVQIQGQIQVSAVSSPSGECKLVLPFVAGTGAEGEQLSCGAVRLYNQTIPSGASYVISWTDANTNYAYITGVVSNAPVSNVVPQTNGYFVFGFTYTTAS
jgi:hypothetical protein